MNILVPVNDKDHVADYIRSGASEFYIGFYDSEWQKLFGDYADINRLTGYRESANPYDFKEVLDIIPKVRALGGSVYITFNSSMYSEEQLDYMERYFGPLKEAGADGVIVSCPELVDRCSKAGLFCVMSTIAGTYNTDIIRFYKSLGAGRVILPRDVTMDEMKMITDEISDIEYEVFIMRSGCMFSDSNCLGMHRNERCSICKSIKSADNDIVMKDFDFHRLNRGEHNNYLYNNWFHSYSCGLCSIYRFMEMNITACKIVGRADGWSYICGDIELIKMNIDIASKCSSNEYYLEQMIFPDDRRERCNMGLSCYYPEMRFK